MADSNEATTTRDGVPSGMIKLAGESNWDKWEFRLLAKLGAKGLSYVLLEEDPALTGARIQVPLPERELQLVWDQEWQRLSWQVYNQWVAAGAVGIQPAADVANMPDMSGLTRIESDAEFRTRCEKYQSDQQATWGIIVASVGDDAEALIHTIDGENGSLAYATLKKAYKSASVSTQVKIIKRMSRAP